MGRRMERLSYHGVIPTMQMRCGVHHHHLHDAQQEHEARALRLSTTKYAVKVEVSLNKPKVNVKGIEFSFLKHPSAVELVSESRCGDL